MSRSSQLTHYPQEARVTPGTALVNIYQPILIISLAIRHKLVHTGSSSSARRDALIATLLLTCAIMTSLAFGVLLAYGVCLGLFRLVHAHAVSVAQRRAPAATATVQN